MPTSSMMMKTMLGYCVPPGGRGVAVAVGCTVGVEAGEGCPSLAPPQPAMSSTPMIAGTHVIRGTRVPIALLLFVAPIDDVVQSRCLAVLRIEQQFDVAPGSYTPRPKTVSIRA